MKHKHSELIKQWADDISLVVLSNGGNGDFVKVLVAPRWNTSSNYFLVCEKHVEVALHWLNGGEVDVWSVVGWGGILEPHFDPACKYRIKPKLEKVKVWVGVHKERDLVVSGKSGLKYTDSLYTWTEVEVDKVVL